MKNPEDKMKIPTTEHVEKLKNSDNQVKKASVVKGYSQLVVRVETELMELFKKACKRDGRPQSQVVRECLIEFVKQMADKPDPQETSFDELKSKY